MKIIEKILNIIKYFVLTLVSLWVMYIIVMMVANTFCGCVKNWF